MIDREKVPQITDEMMSKRLYTDHDKNLDWFADNYPELLDYYILAYENIVDYQGGFLEPEDVLDIVLNVKRIEEYESLEVN